MKKYIRFYKIYINFNVDKFRNIPYNVSYETFLEVGMQQDEISKIISRIPLFTNCSDDTTYAIANASQSFYNIGETICSPETSSRKLIILLEGRANVYLPDMRKRTLLRTMREGELVGIANLYSDHPYVSVVVAEKHCVTIEISERSFMSLIERDKILLANFLSLLSGKICYLNEKLHYCTAGSAERKLALYLDSVSSSDTFELSVSLVSLSDILDVGRASLYRAFDKLQSDGFIVKDGKKITLKNRGKMLLHYTL